MKQTLFVMLGYPGSGKSTFARLLAETTGAVHLNGDDMRLAMFANYKKSVDYALNLLVFGGMDYTVCEVLRRGISVIYSTNTNQARDRRHKAGLAKEFNVPVVVLWVQTPQEVAKEREQLRGTNIPDKAFEGLVHNLEAPGIEELYIRLNGLDEPAKQLESFWKQFNEIRG